MRHASSFLLLVMLASIFLEAQAKHPAAFPPLDKWKSAVVSHDSAALRNLYSSAPAAKISAPKSDLDADAEVAFWMGLNVRDLKIKVSQLDSPEPDLRQLVMTVEIYPKESPDARTLYLSAGEVWQHQSDGWRMIASKRSNAARLEQPLSVSKTIYAQGVDARAEIKHALAVAAKDHKRVIIVFGANWCYDCHVLDAAFHRPDLAAVIAKNYEIVHVDIGEKDKNLDLMEQYEVPIKKGIPGLAILNPDGKLLTSQKNGEFENARALGPEDLLAFLNKWTPPAR